MAYTWQEYACVNEAGPGTASCTAKNEQVRDVFLHLTEAIQHAGKVRNILGWASTMPDIDIRYTHANLASKILGRTVLAEDLAQNAPIWLATFKQIGETMPTQMYSLDTASINQGLDQYAARLRESMSPTPKPSQTQIPPSIPNGDKPPAETGFQVPSCPAGYVFDMGFGQCMAPPSIPGTGGPDSPGVRPNYGYYQAPAQPQTDWSKILLIGGAAAAIFFFLGRRKGNAG